MNSLSSAGFFWQSSRPHRINDAMKSIVNAGSFKNLVYGIAAK
jgi:hypothetical protein